MVGLARPRAGGVSLGALAGAVATGAGIALMAVAGWLLATAAQHPPLTALAVAVVVTRALGVTRGVARYLERLLTHDAALRTLAGVRARVVARLARTEPFERYRTGDLLTRLVSDTDATQDLVIGGITPPLAAAAAGAGAVGLATALLVPGGVLLAVGLALGGIVVPVAAALAGRGVGRRRAAARAELSAAVVDAVHGAADLHAYGAMPRALDRIVDADAVLTRTARRDAFLLAAGVAASALVAGATLWGTLLLAVAAVAGGTLAAVPFAVLVLTALAAFEVVAPLPAAAARLGAVHASGARLFDVLDAPPSVRVRAAAPPVEAPGLRIRGLRVRYGPAEPWALDGVDLDLPPGRRIALIGPSGAGKSTLADVLFRFRDPDGGTVHLDGVDVTTREPDAVRERLSGVPQDPHVFAGTVRENLLVARPDASDAELVAVLDRVRMPAPGLDADVGSGGQRLSGGMRRRLAVARVLLTEPAVLVLDEPTAHLDPTVRDAVLEDLLAATGGRSVLVITHDPAALERFDAVAVLRSGRVAQLGPHRELLSEAGWYRSWMTNRSP
ncbi:thiol reductant ABC exporter subunit CydC [Pseudonocardia broussonetiae]|uniref:Thiol reductant ABC exporter subunit CydC n=2 Tax=Pseudonocardia broussonetiae TaxID=2736640 RepID=A0A6M6JU38_9PSEU|nr:thiol reductant ABC exporter subunit CydC [Pseudonocardia broussonetiae]